MKIKFKWSEVLYWGLLLFPFILALVFYDKMPEEMVTHWGFNNEPDGYSSKAFACFGIPAMLMGTAILVRVLLALDPKRKNIDASMRMKQLGIWAVPVIGLVTQTVVLLTNAGVSLNIGLFVAIPVGVLIIAIGNYLPKCKPNYTMGIRLPWTLNSEDNWRKTHRFAGAFWIAGGFLIILESFLQTGIILYLSIAILLIPPIAYSYWYHRKEQKNKTEE